MAAGEAALFVPHLMKNHAEVRDTGQQRAAAHITAGAAVPCHLRRSTRFLPLQELWAVLHATDEEAHYPVRISVTELAAFNHGAAEVLLQRPRQVWLASCRRLPPAVLTPSLLSSFTPATSLLPPHNNRCCRCWTQHWCWRRSS